MDAAVVRFLDTGGRGKIMIMMIHIKAVTSQKGELFYGWFNADEYDGWRNDVVCDIIRNPRCFVNNSNGSFDKNLTTFQKRAIKII